MHAIPNSEHQSDLTFRDAAERIGSRLCRDALWHGRRCNWTGASMEAIDGRWQVVERSFGGDLYSGTAGIALFLARLYQSSPDPLLGRTVEGALRQALAGADDLPAGSRLGFYTGGVGIAYAAAQWAEIGGDQRWAEAALELLLRLAPEDRKGHILDVVAGTAGAVAPLLELGARLESPEITELAVALGDELLTAAHRREQGWSWNTLMGDAGTLHDHLLGFSHGASGVGWALLELHGATGEERFRHGAAEAMRYERSWFDPRQGNWPDLRRDEAGPGEPPAERPLAYPVQWCHGAPGIGMVRLRALELLGEPLYRSESEIALRTTLPSLHLSPGPPAGPSGPVGPLPANGAGNDSLCHGRSGNADLFLEAHRVLGRPQYKAIAEAVGRRGISMYEAGGLPWPSGVQGGAPTPGLMLGLAGTGYFLLRLANPESTPSILFPVPRGVGSAARSVAA